MMLHIEPYGNRYFALYDGDELVCVTVYKKGAVEVKKRLENALMFLIRESEDQYTSRKEST